MTRPHPLSSLDSTLAFAVHGYRFVSHRCDQLGTDAFCTRLLGTPTVCLRGAEAAELFYATARLHRHGAMPHRVQKTLLGVGGVQGLDGAAHRHRKHLFMSVMTPAAVAALTDLVAACWRRRIPVWQRTGDIVLFDEVAPILGHAVSQWVGLPAGWSTSLARTADLHAMIDAPAAVGPRHWRGKLARRRAERGLGTLVDRVRAGTVEVPAGSPLHIVAHHREPDGQLLPARVAAVELLNLLRPTVAIDRYITFAALALHHHPHWRPQLRDGTDQDLDVFAQEVRRFYPFFPVVAARVHTPFDWQGLPSPPVGGCCSTCTAPTTTPSCGTPRSSSGPTGSGAARPVPTTHPPRRQRP